VFDPVNIDPLGRVFDSIEDTVVPYTNAMPLLIRQLQTSGRTSIRRELSNSLKDAGKVPSFQPIELLLRGWEEEYLKHDVF
jgi:hypothetical protein